MQEHRNRWRHFKCNDKAGNLLHRLRCKWTVDDTAAVVGTCISLLIVLAGTLSYVIAVSLLTRLAHLWPHLQTP